MSELLSLLPDNAISIARITRHLIPILSTGAIASVFTAIWSCTHQSGSWMQKLIYPFIGYSSFTGGFIYLALCFLFQHFVFGDAVGCVAVIGIGVTVLQSLDNSDEEAKRTAAAKSLRFSGSIQLTQIK